MLMRYTLHEAAARGRAARHPDRPGAATSNTARRPAGLDRIYRPGRFAGHRHQLRHRQQLPGRPGSRSRGCERVRDRLVHLHAKDISVQHSDAERGKVTGTPVGCACGDGVIDWATGDRDLPHGARATSSSASSAASIDRPRGA